MSSSPKTTVVLYSDCTASNTALRVTQVCFDMSPILATLAVAVGKTRGPSAPLHLLMSSTHLLTVMVHALHLLELSSYSSGHDGQGGSSTVDDDVRTTWCSCCSTSTVSSGGNGPGSWCLQDCSWLQRQLCEAAGTSSNIRLQPAPLVQQAAGLAWVPLNGKTLSCGPR